MNRKSLLILEIIGIIVLLFNIFVLDIFRYNLAGILFFLILLVVSIMLKGFEKDKTEKTTDWCFLILSYIMVYFTFLYLFGIITGYGKTIYNHSLIGIIKNFVPALCLILVQELFRYQVVLKSHKKDKLNYILLAVLFILYDLRGVFPFTGDIQTLLDTISLVILPSIAKNIMYIYLIYIVGYKPVLIYRIIMDTFQFFVPIYPAIGAYVTGILEICFPFFVCIMMRNSAKKQRTFFVRENKTASRIISFVSLAFLSIVVALVSGYFKYYALGVVSPSMTPEILRGDVVIVEKLSAEQKKDVVEGQVLVFRAMDRVVVHRVVQKYENDGEYVFRTKGDYNENIDDFVIYEKDIIGVAIFKIPKIGYPSIWLSEMGDKY